MKLFVVFIIIFASFLTGCNAQNRLQNTENAPVTLPNGNYQTELKAIETERQNLSNIYQNSTDKKDTIDKVRKFFVTAIEQKIIPFWYGTDWDFYGTTETPKSGKIACGYFVTTVLRDAGLRVNRVSLAQQASENIIKSLVTAPNIKRFNNIAIEKFVADVKTLGEGIYIVGLDNHVGFIFHNGSEVYFIHSSYIEPSEVIREKAIESPILSSSKYRVIGKISDDEELMVKWLSQTLILTIKH
jgi:hypothetical protein